MISYYARIIRLKQGAYTFWKTKFPEFSRFARPCKQFFQTTIKCKHDLTNHLSSQFGSFLAQLQHSNWLWLHPRQSPNLIM